MIATAITALAYFSLLFLVVGSLSEVFEQEYSKQDLVENYNLKTKELAALNSYIDAITPTNTDVHIEFEGQKLGIFHVTTGEKYDSNWDVPLHSAKASQLLQRLGWTQQTLVTLQEKLTAANCISVESGEPCTIGYQRSGMVMYCYKLFDRPLNDSLKARYNDGCHYIFYKRNVVLEYGAGAIGGDCFEGYQGAI